MRLKPEKEYSGLTIVLANPSRFDTQTLLSGYAGVFFNQDCLEPHTTRWRCDIRTADTIGEGLLEGTKGLLLLGERALHTWAIGYENYTINEQRGNPLRSPFNLPCVCSYYPQDAIDFKDYEARLNPQEDKEEGVIDEKEDETDLKGRKGSTRRSNYHFWLIRDTKKILSAIRNHPKPKKANFDIRIFPQADEVIKLLRETKREDLYFDIETDSVKNLSCFGFSVGDSPVVYSVPILYHDYTLAYGARTYEILRSLVIAINANTVVIHNSPFDLFVLAWKYKIPFSRNIYDTMFAQHRCFPEAEKSLGHTISCWPEIWEEYHKDEGIFEPRNMEELKRHLLYNAKDVASMKLVKKAQLNYAQTVPGLEASIQQSNWSIYPFLVNSLYGMLVDVEERDKMMNENDRLMTQYLRAVNALTGPEVNLLPTSTKSCCRYFHDMLEYPVVGRSQKTHEPSLDETNLLKLKLKHKENIVIDFCIKYRQRKKEQGTLKFEPWVK